MFAVWFDSADAECVETRNLIKKFLDEQGEPSAYEDTSSLTQNAANVFRQKFKRLPVIFHKGYLIGGYNDLLAWWRRERGDFVESAELDSTQMTGLPILRLTPRVSLPVATTKGLDIYVDMLAFGEFIAIAPGDDPIQLRTGLAISVPEDHVLRVAPSSQLAKQGLILLSGAVYPRQHNEVLVTVAAIGARPVQIKHNDHLAVGTLEKLILPAVVEVTEL